MADQKIFAGPRIRRIRNATALSQTAMAQGLGISPSYLNLIERNQRPLTVQLILKLASVYKVDPEEFQDQAGSAIPALKEVFSDPLLVGELPGDQELIDLAEGSPNAAAAMIKLYRAYREQNGRLSDFSEMMAREGRGTALSGARLPVDEVRDVLERQPNHVESLETEAEAFSAALDREGGLFNGLAAWLRRDHGIGIRVLPVASMPNWRRRYDRHSQRLFLSERLSPADQLRELATEACLMRMSGAIAAAVAKLALSTDEARRLARFELGRYAAHALMMPYAAFQAAALRARYDIDVLRSRFGVSFEHAATRLTTLTRASAAGLPFFLLEVDHAGHRIRRAGSLGYPHGRFGDGCPKLPVHAAFAQPGQVLVEAVEMPDGARFLCIARTLDGPQGAFAERPRRTALLLACDLAAAGDLVYGAGLPVQGTPPTLIGPVCRLCERVGCLSRAEPPVTRPLGLDEMVSGLSAFDFQ